MPLPRFPPLSQTVLLQQLYRFLDASSESPEVNYARFPRISGSNQPASLIGFCPGGLGFCNNARNQWACDVPILALYCNQIVATVLWFLEEPIMNFDFGTNLRALRSGKGLTQELAAELLNVSIQSISRWENNITLPDISFLPNLASFYGVSVDALLGAEETAKKMLLERYMEAHRTAHHRSDIATAWELSRSLYARFPNEHTAMSDLMNDAYLMGRDAEEPKKREYLNEAMTVAKRYFRMTEDLEEQCSCIRTCALCFKLLEQPDRAREWMMRLPSALPDIDLCAIEILEGEELQNYLQCAISGHVDILQKLLLASASLPDRSDEERRVILEKLPQLLKIGNPG